MLFVDIYAKNVKFGYLNPIFGKLWMTDDLSWWLVKKPWLTFYSAYKLVIEFSSLSVTVPELWGKMCTAWLFSQGVDLFALKFYLDRVVPAVILGIRKQRHWATRRWRPHPSAFLVLTQYRSVTDRRTDGFAVSYTALAKLAVKIAVNLYNIIWYMLPLKRKSSSV